MYLCQYHCNTQPHQELCQVHRAKQQHHVTHAAPITPQPVTWHSKGSSPTATTPAQERAGVADDISPVGSDGARTCPPGCCCGRVNLLGCLLDIILHGCEEICWQRGQAGVLDNVPAAGRQAGRQRQPGLAPSNQQLARACLLRSTLSPAQQPYSALSPAGSRPSRPPTHRTTGE